MPITVTPQQLQEIAGQLNSGASEVESILGQLASLVSPLGSDWVGTAQAQFEELWAQWQRDAAGIHQALTGIAQLTLQAGSQYEQTEQAITSSFRV